MSDFENWGWVGAFKRALEFPSGFIQKALSPLGRARIRYNEAAKQLEQSIDNSAYVPLTTVSPAVLSQATWHINALTGDDTNDGATPTTALKTWAEWDKRIGDGLVSIAMTVFVDSNLNEAGYDVRATLAGTGRAGTPPGGFISFQGERTVIHSGVVSAVQGWDFSLSPIVDGLLTDVTLSGASWSDSGPGGTSLVKKLCVLTSGVHVGKVAWIIKDLGAKRARFSVFFDGNTFAQGTPANGDTFDIVDLTELAGGPVRFRGTALTASQGAFLSDFRILGNGGDAFQNAIEATSPWALNTCAVAGRIDSVVTGFSFLMSSLLDVDPTIPSTVFSGLLGVVACAFFGQLQATGGDSEIEVEANTVAQFDSQANALQLVAENGAKITIVGGGATWAVLDESRATAGTAQIGADCILYLRGRLASLNPTVTAGFGLWIDAGGQAVWNPVGDAASAHMDFDTTTAEIEIGGVVFTVAAVGAGKVTAANLSMAVPRKRFPP